MSSCNDGVCGTGGFAGPKPGDPNSISTFTATPGYGGINLNWNLPTINPYAVAHVRIFRATSSNPAQATLLHVVHGDFYFDIVAPNITYYYWLEVVSVNGTYDAWIGPASSSAMSSIEKTIEEITGRIDAGVLAQSLKTEIGQISLLGNSITTEVTNRIAEINSLAGTISSIQGELTNTITMVEQEVNQRIDSDGAIVTQLDLWAAGFEESIAGITEEVTLQVGPEGALAKRVTTAETSLYGSVSTGEVGLITKVDGIDGKVDDIGALYTVKLQVGTTPEGDKLIGGFGVYNDGTTVQAGFDVDEFWVGRTNANKRKPFMIENGVVYIDEAAIKTLTFNKLRDEQGTFIVQNGKVKANYIDTNGLIIRDANGNAIFGAGTALNVSLISGLGTLATQNTVANTQVTGLGSLATRNTVTTGMVTGLGALATQSSVTTGQVSGLGPFATRPAGGLLPTDMPGLGDLALLDKVSVADVSNLGALAAKDALLAADIADLGALATKNSVTVGDISNLGNLASMNTVDYTLVAGTKPPANATYGAPSGTPVGSSTADTVVTNAANGLAAFTGTSKYRTAGAPTNAPVPTGTSIIVSNNSNGSCNIRLDWAGYIQGANQADFLALFWKKGNTAPTVTDASVLFNVTSTASYHIFEGVNPEDTYSFGLAAGRRTESGIEIGNIVAPAANPDWIGFTGGSAVITADIHASAEIGGVLASELVAARNNFNAANDRKATAISAPTVYSDGSAVDHVVNTDGSVDISFEWNFPVGEEGDIDGFQIYLNESTSSGVYNFGTTPANELVYEVPAVKRSFLLLGTPADKYYTFGVRAYRKVDKDIAINGTIVSTLVRASAFDELPYRPSATVAFNGSVLGTIGSTPAATVVAQASNGNAAHAGTTNYRNPGAPTNTPSISSTSTVSTVDGNSLIKVEFSYTQGALPADTIYVYCKEGGGTVVSSDYNIAVAPNTGVVEFRVKPSTSYSFAVQASRTVDGGPVFTGMSANVSRTSNPAQFSGTTTGLIGTVAASAVATAVNNFNTANDRNGTAIADPTLAGGGICIDHTLQTDGSADISFEWQWQTPAAEGDIDGFQVIVYQSASSAAYNFGTDTTQEVIYEMPASKRAFILYGVAANKYYTFGVRAYRKVDKDINATGVIVSNIVKSAVAGENPYQPSTSVAFDGNITGTVNNIPANQINVWSSISGAGKPENGADVTANHTAADFVGRGVLARQDAVFLGSTVKFPNGDIIGVNDLVTRLSKITGGINGNISTFIDGLAITDAYIGNAAIKNAKIDNLAVDTVKIGNEAVTIPKVSTSSSTIVGTNSAITIMTDTITLTHPGTVYASFTTQLGFSSGVVACAIELYINGTLVAQGAGTAVDFCITLSGAVKNLVAGTYTVQVNWIAANNTASVGLRTMFIQGAMK